MNNYSRIIKANVSQIMSPFLARRALSAAPRSGVLLRSTPPRLTAPPLPMIYDERLRGQNAANKSQFNWNTTGGRGAGRLINWNIRWLINTPSVAMTSILQDKMRSGVRSQVRRWRTRRNSQVSDGKFLDPLGGRTGSDTSERKETGREGNKEGGEEETTSCHVTVTASLTGNGSVSVNPVERRPSAAATDGVLVTYQTQAAIMC